LQALPTWPTFGKGWGRRVADVQAKAASMTA
jgi:lysozyme family protein